MNGTLGVRVLKRVTLFYELTFEYVIGPAKNEIRAMATKFVEPKMSVIVSNLHVAAMAKPVICITIVAANVTSIQNHCWSSEATAVVEFDITWL